MASKTTTGEGVALYVTSDSITDLAGNRAVAIDSSTFKVDKTAPTVTAERSVAPNSYGWNKTDVTVTFSATDSLSGIEDGTLTSPITKSSEGANQSATGYATDQAGNVGSFTENDINLDKTPSISAERDVAPNSNGWNKTDVTVTFTVTDPEKAGSNDRFEASTSVVAPGQTGTLCIDSLCW